VNLKWRIYYGDEKTYSDQSGLLCASPAYNVQAVVQADRDVGRQILSGFDWYILKNKWYGILDIPSLLDQAINCLDDIYIVRMGRLIPSRQYKEIMRRAKYDPGFPAKSATSKIEKPRGSTY